MPYRFRFAAMGLISCSLSLLTAQVMADPPPEVFSAQGEGACYAACGAQRWFTQDLSASQQQAAAPCRSYLDKALQNEQQALPLYRASRQLPHTPQKDDEFNQSMQLFRERTDNIKELKQCVSKTLLAQNEPSANRTFKLRVETRAERNDPYAGKQDKFGPAFANPLEGGAGQKPPVAGGIEDKVLPMLTGSIKYRGQDIFVTTQPGRKTGDRIEGTPVPNPGSPRIFDIVKGKLVSANEYSIDYIKYIDGKEAWPKPPLRMILSLVP